MPMRHADMPMEIEGKNGNYKQSELQSLINSTDAFWLILQLMIHFGGKNKLHVVSHLSKRESLAWDAMIKNSGKINSKILEQHGIGSLPALKSSTFSSSLTEVLHKVMISSWKIWLGSSSSRCSESQFPEEWEEQKYIISKIRNTRKIYNSRNICYKY